jgi:hypothetical protein
MALRSFRGAASNSTVVFTGQSFNRELLDSGAANSTNGSSVVLAAGASASFYLTSATSVPNLTTALTGSWEASIQFQTVAPTNVFCKFRVHRISVSGTTPTILASTEYSAEIQARAINTPYIANTDGTDLGTFSSAHRIAVEWTIRNAGASSITPQPSFGTFARYVRTPIQSSAAVGWVGFAGQAAYRPISYSEGTIRGVKRTGFVRNSITSSGTATGTKGGSNFSGSVTGVSTSTGTVAAGKQGYAGSISGASTSSGTIAAGKQGYLGSITGSSTTSGTIAAGKQGYTGAVSGAITSAGTVAAGLQGYSGAAAGSSTSTGSAQGIPYPPPQPQPDAAQGSTMRQWNQDFGDDRPRIIQLQGRANVQRLYAVGTVFGATGFAGFSTSVTQSAGSANGLLGYYGGVQQLRLLVKHRAHGKARPDLRENRELLLLIGEL